MDGSVLPQEASSQCQPIGATGQLMRRANNPRLVAGQAFTDGTLDRAISDPDVHLEGGVWQVYFAATHATSFADPAPTQVIRRATSVDRIAWQVDETPALEVGDVGAWDHARTEAPTVVMNPDAPAAQRYLMLYAGAARAFPFPGYAVPASGIGAAFSADGKTFTRLPASQSRDGQAGLVLRGSDVYPGVTGAIVADPDVVLVDGIYHLFYSSFACLGASCENVQASGVAHSTSTDGITWTTVEAPVRSLLRASADPRSGGAKPSIVHDARRCLWELWLESDLPTDTAAQPVAFANTAGVWHADSTDALAWHVDYARNRD
ncbi:MAG: hypothetical protein NT062_37725, partial [Proteobacteria bacterium]|nr:hypothetical protein [Pseudomonadota bacterium]